MIYVAPSILSADSMALGQDVVSVEQSGADYLHIDVMDGHFVPNLSFGIDLVKQLRQVTTLSLDVHLMLSQPERFVEKFAEAGADIISVHIEACSHIHRVIQQIKQAGCLAGVVLCPGTPASQLTQVLHDVDLVLQMTVNPGFGGQAFITSTLENIRYLNQWRNENNVNFLIEVDGGINLETAQLCKDAGADILVAGSFFFGSRDRRKMVMQLKSVVNSINS